MAPEKLEDPPMRRRALLATGLALPHLALAETRWPERPIRLVVSWPPGGGADTPARLVAPHMQKVLGQGIVIENRGGASGAIGAGAVAQAAPDGYTFLADTSGIVTNSLTVPNLGYDAEKALTPVGKLVDSPLILVVRPEEPARNLPQLIERMRAAGGKLTFASSGSGGGTYLAVILLLQRAGVQATHVAYRGGAQSIMGLLGGDAVFSFSTLPQATPLVMEGRLRALAVSTANRLANLPEVPTVAEQGFPGYAYAEFLGFHAPAGTPEEPIHRFWEAAAEALQQPEVQARLGQIGMLPAPLGPEEFRRFLDDYRATVRARIADGSFRRDE
jgi:tripartite-type tricarboxylate transporter receptor subunit TctC